jgi:rhodanese-related sulfurtransferase
MVEDRQGGHVRGSSQWPAQTFYDDLDQFYEKFQNIGKVIFYCNRSNGRGPRCAGWWAILSTECYAGLRCYSLYRRRYQDRLNAQANTTSRAFILQGGIHAWLEKFGGTLDLVDKDPTD